MNAHRAGPFHPHVPESFVDMLCEGDLDGRPEETPKVTVRQAVQDGHIVFVASVGSHQSLLARTTESDARRDGLAYFLATRKRNAAGEWVIA